MEKANINNDKEIKLKSLSRKKLSNDVADQILKLIEDGFLKPGDKIPPERKLMEELAVSRTAVREGMQRLEMMGIIEIRAGQGTFVTKNKKISHLMLNLLKLDDKLKKNILLELLELRKILEVGIVDIVAKRGTEKDFARLGKCIEQHRIDIEKNHYPSKGDALFHRLLAVATHNKMILDFFDGIYDLIKGSLIFTGDRKKNRETGFKFHERIYDAVVSRDSQTAQEVMGEHIDWIKDIVVKRRRF